MCIKFFIASFILLTGISYSDLTPVKYIDSARSFNELPIISVDSYEYINSSQKHAKISRFLLFRHGESISNAEKSMAGRTLDIDLSEKGKQQALDAGQRLAQSALPIHAVYSSPSLRTKRTAEFLLSKPTLTLDDRLYERFYGPYEGASEKEYLPIKKLEETENSGPNKQFSDKFAFKPHPEMESMSEVCDRMIDFLREKHKEHLGENVIVLTHNAPMKALFMYASAVQGYDVDYTSFDLKNLSMLIVEVGDDQITVKAASGLKFR